MPADPFKIGYGVAKPVSSKSRHQIFNLQDLPGFFSSEIGQEFYAKYAIMASPPPPYENITGISRTVMKDNAQESLANYNGNARPGEMTVDLSTYDIYIGNTDGNLNLVFSTTLPLQIPTKTQAQSATILGSAGQIIAITDSPGVAGRIAFWDTTNSRWSYVIDNSAV
jgi:hypothetical protein